jgi:hypothetical protein
MSLSVEAIREALQTQPDSTHYEGCWEHHGWCAASYLLAVIEELKPSNLKAKVGRDRLLSGPECGPLMHDTTRADWYRYCPVCGEKL